MISFCSSFAMGSEIFSSFYCYVSDWLLVATAVVSVQVYSYFY